MKKEFIYGLIVGLLLAILIGNSLVAYINNQKVQELAYGRGIEGVKNEGCRDYILQTPTCSDWTKVNVTWQGKLMSYDEFIREYFIEYFKTYSAINCSGEDCARIFCSCPGY